jgi:hypothetical protein
MEKLGYAGIIVTDHFFNGNCSVPKELPWEERVDLYCRGYERALAASKGHDLTVMFGIEYYFQGDEYLLYGVDKNWLLDNPDITTKSRKEVFDLVHQGGGIMIHAHPYRERGYLSTIHLMPSVCDGAESYNAGNPDYQNALGYRFAKEHNFITTGGSDIHYPMQDMGGTSFPYKINNIQEFVKALMAGDGTVVCKKDADTNPEFTPIDQIPSLVNVSQEATLPVIDHDKE